MTADTWEEIVTYGLIAAACGLVAGRGTWIMRVLA